MVKEWKVKIKNREANLGCGRTAYGATQKVNTEGLSFH